MQLSQTAYTVFVKKAAKSYTFDINELSPHVIEYVLDFGFRQLLTDKVGKKDITQDEARGLADKRYTSLVGGTIRASSGRTSDPVAREAQTLAVDAVAKGLVKKGAAKNATEAAKHADFKSLCAEYAKRETTLEKARAIVALRADDEEEIDID